MAGEDDEVTGSHEAPLPDHPVLRLMERSTRVVERFSNKHRSLERTVSVMSGKIDLLERTLHDLAVEKRRLADEQKRANDLKDADARHHELVLGERWSRFSAGARIVWKSFTGAVSHPLVAMPLGVVSYGVAKWLAVYFGIPLLERMP